ncbi:putative WD repeat-containing protein [Tropilaelaps mercedesae]|uniref:Putative WD repeat-containing protein n=1 Tax=Tropilaelaps mercedesae TaxID=418985 RepID=A0A1V9XMC1_9ACAR|nr:putative WD repeat-containing protein [Tropilaelaps mercedesae]
MKVGSSAPNLIYRRRLPPLAPPESRQIFDITSLLPPPAPFTASQQLRYSYNLAGCDPALGHGQPKIRVSMWAMQTPPLSPRPLVRTDWQQPLIAFGRCGAGIAQSHVTVKTMPDQAASSGPSAGAHCSLHIVSLGSRSITVSGALSALWARMRRTAAPALAPGTSASTSAQRGMGCGSSQAAASSAAKGWVIQQFDEHKGPINCSALSEDESLLITGSEDGTVKMWSTQSEPVELLGTLVGHTSYITQCSVHGSFVVSASADGTLKKWSIADASCVFTFHGHTARINRIVCNGDFVISTSMDKTVRVWHFHAERFAPPNPLEDIPDEASETGKVGDVLDAQNEGRDLDLIEAAILARRLSLLSASVKDETITVKPRESMTSEHGTFISYDGVSQKSFEEIHSQRKKSKHKECIQVLKGHLKGVFPVLYIPFEQETPIHEPNGNERFDQESPNDDDLLGSRGDIVVTGSFDCTARSWDLLSGKCLKVFKGHTQAVNDLAVDPGAEYLFTAGGDGTVRQWVLRTGECKRVLTGHQGPVVNLIVTRGRLFTGSYDGTLFVWDTTGVTDETVFGVDEEPEESEEDDDDVNVQKAMKILDGFVHGT